MDPVTAIVIFTSIASILGSAAAEYDNYLRTGRSINVNEVRSYITNAYNKAWSMGNRKVEQLTDKLLSLSVVQSTPALREAVDRMALKLQRKKNELQNDLDALEASRVSANVALDAINDGKMVTTQDDPSVEQIKDKKEIKDNVSKIEEIQQKFEKFV